MDKARYDFEIAHAENNFRDETSTHLHIDKALIKEMFDLTDKKVLDFGCGSGGMSLWYAKNWDCEVTGFDIDRSYIFLANELQAKLKIPNATFSQRNIVDEPLKSSEKFDFIFLNDVAEHIELSILQNIFNQLKKALNKNGKIFVTYPPWRSPHASHVTHVTKIPWCQYLPKKLLFKLIEKDNRVLGGEIENTLLEAYHGLNHLTHKKMAKVAEEANLKITFRNSHSMLNRIPVLNKLKHLTPFNFLITKEFLLLK